MRNLDALRGLLAVYVLLGHARWLLWTGHTNWFAQPHADWAVPLAYGSASFRFGREAVLVFFALSGLFIHWRAARTVAGGGRPALEPARFFARRAHRLLPPYALALLVTVVCDVIGRLWWPTLYSSATGDGLLDQIFANGGYGSDSVVPALVLLPSSLGRDFGSNGPLWSLAYEVIYYAAYPLWLAARRRSTWLAFAGVPLACLALPMIAPQTFSVRVAVFYPVWLAGAALAEALASGAMRSQPAATLRWWAGAAGCSGFALYLWLAPLSFKAVGATMFAAAAVVAFATMPATWEHSRFLRWWQFLGVRSYTIYIVHFPALALISAAVLHLGGVRPQHGWFALAGAAVAIGFGCVCFAICERHFLHDRLVVSAEGTGLG